MAATDVLEQCTHCKKEVAKPNLSMHEAHCRRFLCVCPNCEELVPKEQLEEHHTQQHTLVKCEKCNMKMERQNLGDHETSECPKRLQSCEFCELDLPNSAMTEHTVACGSRTERCPDCKQYVMLKDQPSHAQICSSSLTEEHPSDKEKFIYDYTKPPPDGYLKDFKLGTLSSDQSDLPANLSRDSKSGRRNPSDLSFSVLKKTKNRGPPAWGDDQISTCPYCHLALPLPTLQWHENKCKIFESLKLKTTEDN